MSYEVIVQLTSMLKKHQLSLKLLSYVRKDLLWVALKSPNIYLEILVYDEYHDFNENNQELALFFVLSAMEDYEETDDYLEWLKDHFLNNEAEAYLEYYRNLDGIYHSILKLLGTVDSGIPALEVQLRSGAYAALIALKKKN